MLDDDECISYSTLDLIFFSYYSAMSVIYTVDTIHDQLGKKEFAGCDIIQFLSYIPYSIDRNPCFFYSNFAFTKAKELFFSISTGWHSAWESSTPFWVITLLGQSTTLSRLYI